MKIIKGNLVTLAKEGHFDVIAHGCNCFCRQKSGLAKQLADTFMTNKFILEQPEYCGDFDKLGRINGNTIGLYINNETVILDVVNCYTQYEYGYDKSIRYVDYDALTMCMKKINHIFKDKEVGLPWIGCGLANGDKNIVEQIYKSTLTDVQLTIVEYEN